MAMETGRENNYLNHHSGFVGLSEIRSSLFYVFHSWIIGSNYIQIFFCYIALFGTGNFASITSFDISSTYRFTTIFDPFLMTALLVFKLLVPIILVGCVYRMINRKLSIDEGATFFLVVALGDVMTLNFFFLVKVCGKNK